MLTLFLSLALPTYIVRMIILSANARRVQRGDYVIDTVVIGVGSDNESRLKKIQKSANRSGIKLKAIIDINNLTNGDSVLGLLYTEATMYWKSARRLKAQAVVILPTSRGLAQST